jgi:SAM-dependent methyltransferase
VCGGNSFREHKVLRARLIADWQLSEEEVAYIDRQQGLACIACGANLRAVALAKAIRKAMSTELSVLSAVESGDFGDWHVLDLNGALGLSRVLSKLPHYVRADFPEYDMMHLPFADGAFDLVFHSDTLEHVAQPLRALEECRRILKPGRRLCFTAPIVVGRLSRSRAGLPKSYHGDPAACQEDFIVHSEFGADLWTLLMRAGFPNVMLSEIEYPSGLALSAWTESQVMSSSGSASAASADRSIYDQDGLRSIHNHEFMGDPAFKAAYQRGVQAAGTDYRWHWRVHVGLWAASVAAKLPGDFVEFGVNRGFMSSAIMTMLGWNEIGRTFYLLDTFAGLDEHYLSAEDLANGAIAHNEQALASGFYTRNLDAVRRNFSEWPNARIIVGPVPDTLSQLHAEQIAFVHIDMNCALPEVAAVEFIWDRLVAGALVLLDDYAYHGYRPQKVAMDTFADSKGMRILSLPTGQGLLIKADAS